MVTTLPSLAIRVSIIASSMPFPWLLAISAILFFRSVLSNGEIEITILE